MSVKKQAKAEDCSGAPSLGWASVLYTQRPGVVAALLPTTCTTPWVEGPAGMVATSHSFQTGHVTVERKETPLVAS